METWETLSHVGVVFFFRVCVSVRARRGRRGVGILEEEESVS